MKREKGRIKVRLLEALLELVVMLVCVGLGALVILLLGFDLDLSKLDFEIVVLVGVVVFIALLLISNFFVQRIKRLFKK